MLNKINCNLCKSTGKEVLYSFGEFSIVKCKCCRLIYVNPILSWQELKELYSKDYFVNNDYSRGYQNYLKDEKNNITTFSRRLKSIEKHKEIGNILEVGCATGIFLMLARKRGWDVSGVEISDFAVEYAKKKFNLDIFKGTLKEKKYPDNFFDVIVMDNVIEHFPDPVSELKEANRILKKDGLLYIVTPNIEGFFARFVGKKWLLLKPEEHLYYFSPETIKKILDINGFKPLKVKSIGKMCSLEFLAVRLKQYSLLLSKWLGFIIRTLNIKNVSFNVDIGDVMVVYAKKNNDL